MSYPLPYLRLIVVPVLVPMQKPANTELLDYALIQKLLYVRFLLSDTKNKLFRLVTMI